MLGLCLTLGSILVRSRLALSVSNVLRDLVVVSPGLRLVETLLTSKVGQPSLAQPPGETSTSPGVYHTSLRCIMFEVLTTSPLDETWEERDEKLYEIVGRKSNFNGAGKERGKEGIREHGWLVQSFEEARQLKKLLRMVPKVKVTIREH